MATLLEHEGPVNSLAVSYDQTYFASASSDHTVKIWRVPGLDRISFPR